jgi:hypothetical protein
VENPRKLANLKNTLGYFEVMFSDLELPKIPPKFMAKKPLDLVRLPRIEREHLSGGLTILNYHVVCPSFMNATEK